MGLRNDLRGLVAAARGDDHMRYRIAEMVAWKIHPQAILSGRERNWLNDQEFRAVFRRFRGDRPSRTMDRAYFVGQLAQWAGRLDGDTAECGSFTGLTSYEMCRHTQPGKHHHVFDSFEGLPDPEDGDGTYYERGELAASEELVRHNLAEFDVITYKGWIPDRFEEVADRRFCMVHIDVDLYQPTRASLEFFYDRVVSGGLILCDDYGFGTCPGATRAFDEFFADRAEIVVSAPTGQGFVVKD